jgi:hypothetical protein
MRAARRDPFAVIADAIGAHVRRRLRQAGAAFAGLQVSVADDRDGATPFRVSYRSLTGVKGGRGARDGSFIMEYAGAQSWRGTLAGITFVVPVGRTDDIDRPFVDDSRIIGTWQSIDLVPTMASFEPGQRRWTGDLSLDTLTFLPGGRTAQPWLTWTKGLLLHRGDRTASRYSIRRLAGRTFLFLQWKSGDVTISGKRPEYYVMEAVDPRGASISTARFDAD